MAAKWFEEQPGNRNFLSPVGFKLDLELFPGVDFFCQRSGVPDISVGTTEVATPFRSLSIPSAGGIRYGDFRVKFIIDENLTNYLSIFNWIQKNNLSESYDSSDIDFCNAELHILNSNFNTNRIVFFEKLFPIDLSGVEFDVADQDIEYITADVTFKFFRYYFTDKNHQEL
jgi:hypothetical protein